MLIHCLLLPNCLHCCQKNPIFFLQKKSGKRGKTIGKIGKIGIKAKNREASFTLSPSATDRASYATVNGKKPHTRSYTYHAHWRPANNIPHWLLHQHSMHWCVAIFILCVHIGPSIDQVFYCRVMSLITSQVEWCFSFVVACIQVGMALFERQD